MNFGMLEIRLAIGKASGRLDEKIRAYTDFRRPRAKPKIGIY